MEEVKAKLKIERLQEHEIRNQKMEKLLNEFDRISEEAEKKREGLSSQEVMEDVRKKKQALLGVVIAGSDSEEEEANVTKRRFSRDDLSAIQKR
jgi:hypothetical protein